MDLAILVGWLFLCFDAATGTRCLSCASMPSSVPCGTSTTCSTGQECYAKYVLKQDGAITYELGCQDSKTCPGQMGTHLLIGKRATGDDEICHKCCKEDMCNTGTLCSVTTTTEATTTTMPTTTAGCPPFPDDCPNIGSCIDVDENFCPICLCNAGYTTPRSTGCPPIQCLLECGNPPKFKKDGNGCEVCKCDFSGSNKSSMLMLLRSHQL